MTNKGISSSKIPHTPVTKTKTGVRGLDAVLGGGLPVGKTTLLSGGPGTGKTILAMEFLYRGAQNGKAGLFISFEEREEDILSNAAAIGMDVAGMEDAGKLKCIHADVPYKTVKSGEFNIQGLLAILDGHIRAMKADRIVLDAIDVLMRLFDNPKREREELYFLHDWLRDRGMTAVLTVKASPQGKQAYPFLDFMADCVLMLDQRMTGQVRTRRITVLKYRGSGFLSNEHPYVISPHGIILIPLSAMSLEQVVSDERISSGIDTFDSLLGGGYRRASSILMAGSRGTGKTTMACSFVRAACRDKQKVLYICYEESGSALMRDMAAVGIDLAPSMKEGMLRVLARLPEEAGSEEHLISIMEEMQEFAPQHLVIDSISACERMGTESAAFDFVVRLLTTCRRKGITCIFTNQVPDSVSMTRETGMGISSLLDSLIALQYSDDGHELSRRLLIVKSRGTSHSMTYHKFRITSDGIVLDDLDKKPDMTKDRRIRV